MPSAEPASMAEGEPRSEEHQAFLLPVFPRFKFLGYPPKMKGNVPEKVDQLPLFQVLTQRFRTNAQFCAYSSDLPYRLNMEAVGLARIQLHLFVADIDCPSAHAATSVRPAPEASDAWRRETREKMRRAMERYPSHAYETQGGIRPVWALRETFPIVDEDSATRWKIYYLRVGCYLYREFGLALDPECCNWNRNFRAPHATRRGNRLPEDRPFLGDPNVIGVLDYQPESVDLEVDLLTADELTASHNRRWDGLRKALTEGVLRKPTRRRPVRAKSSGERPLDPLERRIAESLAPVVGQFTDNRHALYLALAGALAPLGLGEDGVLAIVTEIVTSVGDYKLEERLHDTRSTFERYARGTRHTGYPTLQEKFPEVAAALEIALQSERRGLSTFRRRFASEDPTVRCTREEARSRIHSALLEASRDTGAVHVISCTAGTGKTRATLEWVAGLDRPVVFATANNDLVADAAAALESASPGCSTTFLGLLARSGLHGGAQCPYHAIASKVQDAGVSPGRSLCLTCDHRHRCELRRRGPAARVTITNHALLDAAPEDCLTIIDEMPPPFEHITFGASDLKGLLRALRANLLYPKASELLAAYCRGLQTACERESDEPEEDWRASMADYFDKNGPAVRFGDPLFDNFAASAEAIGLKVPVPIPPWTTEVFRSGSEAVVRTQGFRIRIVDAILSFLMRDRPALLWRPAAADQTARSCLSIHMVSRGLHRAMARPGGIVMLGLAPDQAAMQLLAGNRDLRFHRVEVRDNVQVSRTLNYWCQASKTKLLPDGPDWNTVKRPLLWILDWASKHCVKCLLLVTFVELAQELRSWLRGEPTGVGRDCASVLKRFCDHGVQLLVFHYGNVAGRNAFDGRGWDLLDGVATLGDPVPNIDAMGAQGCMLGSGPDGPERDARLEDLTRLELSQAHGRIRAVVRDRPGHLLHIGRVLPGDWDHGNTVIKVPPEGRPPSIKAMTREALEKLIEQAGSVRELARRSGVSASAISGYRNGRAVSEEAAAKLKASLPAAGGRG